MEMWNLRISTVLRKKRYIYIPKSFVIYEDKWKKFWEEMMAGRRIQSWLTDKEFIKLLQNTYKAHHKTAFILAFHCGLRVSEVVNLKPDDIDRGQGLLKVVQGKGGKDRFIPYPPKIAKHFKELPIGCTPRALQLSIKSAIARAGIKKDIHFHSLRHSFCTNLINKGVGYKTVQQLAGHSSISITMDIYSHMTLDQSKKELQEKVWG